MKQGRRPQGASAEPAPGEARADLSADGRAAGLPALDRAELMQRCAGDAALAEELLALFETKLLPDAARLAALADGAERGAVAHRLRGAALAIGAREMAAVAGSIEAGGGTELLFPALARLRAALAGRHGS